MPTFPGRIGKVCLRGSARGWQGASRYVFVLGAFMIPKLAFNVFAGTHEACTMGSVLSLQEHPLCLGISCFELLMVPTLLFPLLSIVSPHWSRGVSTSSAHIFVALSWVHCHSHRRHNAAFRLHEVPVRYCSRICASKFKARPESETTPNVTK